MQLFNIISHYIKHLFLSFCLVFALAIIPFSAAQADPIDKAELEKMFETYILANPEIIRDALIILQQRAENGRKAEIDLIIKSQAALINNPKNMYIGGNPDGDVTIVEFFDYNCFYCKQAFEAINKLLENDKNLKIVMYELPILAQSSLTAAQVSLASLQQNKYWQLHSELIAVKGQLTDEMIFAIAADVGLDMDKIKQDMDSQAVEDALSFASQLAESLDIKGTPAFIIDGKLYPGAIGYDNMLEVVTKARAKKLK